MEESLECVSLRVRQERREAEYFSPFACLSSQTKGRDRPLSPCDLRTEFQRDIDRIVHCKAFRRLKHKTQVFLLPEGDHYRTRMTHTLEVSRIARTIARGLSLNEDLVEAIALGHDLGHTPYGHAGEQALHQLMEARVGRSFRHNHHSLRIVTLLEEGGAGLNLTWEVQDGILHHSGTGRASTLEGRIVALADRIAYINHDIQDAIRAKVLYPLDLPLDCLAVLGYSHGARVDRLTVDVITHSQGKEDIVQSQEVGEAMQELRRFMFQEVYTNPIAKSEEVKAKDSLCRLFLYYCDHTEEMPKDFQEIVIRDGVEQGVCDFIAGMTDTYAGSEFSRLFVPMGWGQRR